MSNCLMECGGVRKDANWVSCEESDIMAQFFNQDLNQSAQALFWPEFEFSGTSNSNLNLNLNPNSSENESYCLDGININSYPPSEDLSLVQEQHIDQYLNLITNPNPNYDAAINEEIRDYSCVLSDQSMQQKRKFYEVENSNGCPEKKAQVKRGARKSRSKRARNGEEEESNVGTELDGSSCNRCNSDDDSNGSGSTSPRPKGKARAGRGSATDPQSLYARKRRERINERLKVLQHLVPNGTKVDISTMLEEAVQYVKFLQIQIKMLSSDEMWMYAPIAYNGMNLGLDLNILAPKF